MTGKIRNWSIRIVATAGIVALLVSGSAAAAFASGSYPTLAASNIRSGPGTSYPIVGGVANGASVTIDCYLDGESISGTIIWDHIVGSGYISDALVKTGSDGPVVPLCGSSQPANTYPTLANTNVRSAANTSSSIVITLPQGAQVTIDCYINGQGVSGTTIWDHRAAGGYISDSLLRTGSDNAVVPACAPSAASNALGDLMARDYVAANWASQNYDVPIGPPVIWPDDCTYFVSTALKLSGMKTTSQWTDNSKDTNLLSSKRFANPGPTKAFALADGFVSYMVSAGNATKVPISWSDNTASHAWPGDVIAYDWDGNGVIDHLAMVVSLNSSGYPSVVQESPSQLRYWSWSAEHSTWIQSLHPHSKSFLIHFTK